MPRNLHEALDNFRSVERLKLIKPYEKLFDLETKRLKKENVFTSRFALASFVVVVSVSDDVQSAHCLPVSLSLTPWMRLRNSY